MSIRVLVTGYGGFLGAAICRSLLSQGYRVRGIARGDYPELEQLGVEVIRGSVIDAVVCDEAVRGMDAIIHTAALAGVWGPKRAYEQTNIEATDLLIDASRRHKLRAFVFTSSPSVTFDGSPQSGIDESVPYPTKWLCDYPRTKAISEQRVLEANDSGTMSTCALRPHLIWGVGDPHLIPRVIERCRSGRLRRVGDGRNLIDTVHVENAAIAHCLALGRLLDHDARASGRAYFITDGEPQGCWDWIRTILECAGLKAPERRISLEQATRIGGAFEVIYRWLRISAEPPMTRFVAAQLGVDHYFKIDSARERLSYQPEANRAGRVAQLKAWLSKASG